MSGDSGYKILLYFSKIAVLFLICLSLFYAQCRGTTTLTEEEATFEGGAASESEETTELSVTIDSPESDTSITAGESVAFSATVSGGSGDLSYAWDFNGDAAGDSTDEDPGEIAYNEAGTYSVTLTVTDETDASVQDTVAVQVSASGSVSAVITATIGEPADDQTILLGDSVTFSGTGASDDEDATLTYSWDFDGDGTADSTNEDPGSYSYSTTGTYTATFTVTDADSNSSSDTVGIVVNSPSITATIDEPAADQTILVGGSVTFSGSGSSEDTDATLTYAWDFDGDGTVDSTNEDPGSYSYSTSGTYTATFTVTDADGNSSSDTVGVIVTGVTQVAAGAKHSCALKSDKTVYCWGWNGYGQLGNGSTDSSSTPVAVSGIDSATQIALGFNHSCALLEDGTVKCWGLNSYGRLGDGTADNASKPVSVSSVTDVTQIAAGTFHTCALISDGSIKCWGRNNKGQLGDGSTTDSSKAVSVSGIDSSTPASAIAAGNLFTCALMSSGNIKCWGGNASYQLGDGTTTNSSKPVDVAGLDTSSSVTKITTGYHHACVLKEDGSIQCWGANTTGQLGDGTGATGSSPVSVSGIDSSAPASSVGAGNSHTCAAMSDGSAKCWGYNNKGQLGEGSTSNSSTPASVSGIDSSAPASSVGAGNSHTCAAMSDGSAKCWGLNGSGQLGNGDTTDSSTPVSVSF